MGVRNPAEPLSLGLFSAISTIWLPFITIRYAMFTAKEYTFLLQHGIQGDTSRNIQLGFSRGKGVHMALDGVHGYSGVVTPNVIQQIHCHHGTCEPTGLYSADGLSSRHDPQRLIGSVGAFDNLLGLHVRPEQCSVLHVRGSCNNIFNKHWYSLQATLLQPSGSTVGQPSSSEASSQSGISSHL
ncbi:hypothetical protein E2C01_001340 [Portunus trituberculatus]|uniref:Uncharacterized protein n=1 Tax=Portunus trituberculatus TaxID=210409 RepID=A0A5B7CGX6_PORTR|nr:hypothetical protein [Portunus trituberculatus]